MIASSARSGYSRDVNANVAKGLVVSKALVADGVMHDLEGADEADKIVDALPVEERREIVSQLVDAASAGGKLSPLERHGVKRVTKALGL